MESQCLGLAEALGVTPVVKRVAPRFPWTVLPPQLWLRPFSAPGPAGDALAPPWPELLIATGRQTVALSIAIRRAAQGGTFTVQIQDPRVDVRRFDVVVAPAHDGLAGENVVTTTGALHRVTAARLAREADRFHLRLRYLPRPRIAVLIGGTNRHYRMSRAAAERLADGLARLATVHKAGLMITPSRRTGMRNQALISGKLAGLRVEIWDGSGENPYFGYLGLADAVVVTGDSINMVSEACATGKPVFVFALDGGSDKFRRFHATLEEMGITRPFTGELPQWRYDPLDDTGRVAEDVRHRMEKAARFHRFEGLDN